MKKYWVLFSLFILPLVFYIFLLTGTNNFSKLPILTKNINDIDYLSDLVSLDGKISIVCFLGNNIKKSENNAFNLNEKIYKHFYQFKDFQFIAVVPKGTENQIAQLKKELGFITDMQKWNFIYSTPENIERFFNSLKTPYTITKNSYYSPYAFIIDKDKNLRGRKDDEDVKNGLLYGYNAETVATIHNKMVDDVKVLIAEYRLALKKNKREI